MRRAASGVAASILASLLMMIALTGCSPYRRAEARAARVPVAEVERIERERPEILLPADEFLARVVPGAGECAPGPFNPYAYASCCDGAACRGQCVATDNQVSCSCFGDEGGCAAGEVCCTYRQGCSLPEDCQGV